MKFVNLERLELISTYRCNSNCKHCLIEPHEYQGQTMPIHQAKRVTKEICETFNPISVMVFGGEPVLALETTTTALETAKNYRIPHRQVLTNGFWGENAEDPNIKLTARALKNGGTNVVHFSLDAFHQDYVPFDVLMKSAQHMIERGPLEVKFSPRWLITKEHSNDFNKRTRTLLKRVEEIGYQTIEGDTIQPRGCALKNLKQYFSPIDLETADTCVEVRNGRAIDDIRAICISPIGDVIICNNIIIGNVNEKSVIKILADYNPYAQEDLKTILNYGVLGLKDLAKSKGIDLKSREFYSICDACLHWRSQLGFTKSCKS